MVVVEEVSEAAAPHISPMLGGPRLAPTRCVLALLLIAGHRTG